MKDVEPDHVGAGPSRSCRTVWVVESGVDFEDCSEIVGIFDSEELALSAVEHYKRGHEYDRWVRGLDLDATSWENGRECISCYDVDVESRPRPEWERS